MLFSVIMDTERCQLIKHGLGQQSEAIPGGIASDLHNKVHIFPSPRLSMAAISFSIYWFGIDSDNDL